MYRRKKFRNNDQPLRGKRYIVPLSERLPVYFDQDLCWDVMSHRKYSVRGITTKEQEGKTKVKNYLTQQRTKFISNGEKVIAKCERSRKTNKRNNGEE